MKKIIALTAGLLVASSAFASTHTSYSETTKVSPSFETKSEALQAGFDIADAIQDMSAHELRSELPTFAYTGVNKIAVDETQVAVEEFAVTRGNIQYRAIVDVNYHFNSNDRD